MTSSPRPQTDVLGYEDHDARLCRLARSLVTALVLSGRPGHQEAGLQIIPASLPAVVITGRGAWDKGVSLVPSGEAGGVMYRLKHHVRTRIWLIPFLGLLGGLGLAVVTIAVDRAHHFSLVG